MLDGIFGCEHFLGRDKTGYFEGWYFRHSGNNPFSVIVGISSGDDSHSFIQYIDKDISRFYRFSLEDFNYNRSDMTILVKNNIFSLQGITAELDNEEGKIKIAVSYSHHNLFQKSALIPSAMGAFSYLPMTCKHAVISLLHAVKGSVTIGRKKLNVSGEGYIEKDYGTSFPENYVWLHAINSTTSIMAAVAYPLIFGIRGHICLVHHLGRQYNLSLYAGGQLADFSVSPDSVNMIITRGKSIIELSSEGGESGKPLLAPANLGMMNKQILENLTAPLSSRLLLSGVKINAPTECALEISLKN